MKADVAQQHSLLKLAELDTELARLAHRARNLAEQQECERIQVDRTAAGDRCAALDIAVTDLDTQAQRFESEIDAVRQREDRDRALIGSGDVTAKQVGELQHELETLQRRQASLEDSLLELLTQREQLQTQRAAEAAVADALQADLTAAQAARDSALAEIENTRGQRATQREAVASGIAADLLALYERQRAAGGIGAGPLRGRQCGACRIEIDRGELARISAVPADEVPRCPECSAILVRVQDPGQ